MLHLLLGAELAAHLLLIVQVLSDLQDRLQPFPTNLAMAVIEEELHASIGDVFSQLSAQPVAAASLGQVCLSLHAMPDKSPG